MNKKELKKKQLIEKEDRNKNLIDLKNKSDQKTLLFITLGVLVFLLLVYVGSNIINGEWNLFTSTNDPIPSIDTTMVMCGNMVKTDVEYLVFAYDFDGTDSSVYEALFSKAGNSIPIYRMDLGDGFNKTCVGEKSNFVLDATKIKFSDATLLHIKNNKIVKSYVGKVKIQGYFA